MKIRSYEEKVKFLQEGGQMPAGAPAGAPQGADPLTQILQMAAEAVQSGNCEAAMTVCDALLQLAQGGQQTPVGAQSGEPVFKKGGKMKRKCEHGGIVIGNKTMKLPDGDKVNFKKTFIKK